MFLETQEKQMSVCSRKQIWNLCKKEIQARTQPSACYYSVGYTWVVETRIESISEEASNSLDAPKSWFGLMRTRSGIGESWVENP